MNENNSYAVFDVTVFDMEVGKWCWCLFQTEHVSFVANEWNKLLDNLGADKKPPTRRYFKVASYFFIYPRNRQPTNEPTPVVQSLHNDLHLN